MEKSKRGRDDRQVLEKEFFARDTVEVSREIVGKVMEHTTPDGVFSAIICEAEAYSQEEASCHAFKGKTKRNEAMFAEPGTIYLYYIYGKNICINFSTDVAGKGCAVLIRAAHPLKGQELLAPVKNKKKLMDGPAKMVKQLRIPFEYYGQRVNGINKSIGLIDKVWEEQIKTEVILRNY